MIPLSSAIIINRYMFISLLTVLAGSNVDVIRVFNTSAAQVYSYIFSEESKSCVQ